MEPRRRFIFYALFIILKGDKTHDFYIVKLLYLHKKVTIMGNSEITVYQNLHFTFSTSWTKLISARESNNQSAFNEIMLGILPELKKYIARRLKVSIKKGKLPTDKYQVNEFVDTIFVEAYDKISDMDDSKQFANWVYAKVDELLEDTVVEEEFNDLFFENMDKYEQPEWEAMQENYSVDGDGDFIMNEELNDPSYPDHEYTLKDVFIEDEEIIDALDTNLKTKQVNEHIKLAVHNLPLDERVPFEMNVAHQIDLEDIAHIQKKEINIVKQEITNARKKIAKSFKTRFAIL